MKTYEFQATPEEAAAIEELCKQQELSEQQVLRQALRMYQGVIKGAFKLEHVNQLSKLPDHPLAVHDQDGQPVGFFGKW